jgi:hypothetical protein
MGECTHGGGVASRWPRFADRRGAELKGVPGEWRLFAVSG